MVYNSIRRTHSAYNEIWIKVFIRSSHTERMLQTNETVLQNFDLGSCLYLCGSIKLLQFMARYMARVAPLITITILCGCGISCYINCDLLFQVLIFAIRMWLLRCLVSTYDQIPDIFFTLSVWSVADVPTCVTSPSGNEWQERSVFTGWVIEQLRCLFCFILLLFAMNVVKG